MRVGLFQILFLRVLAIIGASLFTIIALSHFYLETRLSASWRSDLQQEAAWIARHIQLSPDVQPRGVETSRQLAAAWRTLHESVRLAIFDSSGRLVADSHPDAPYQYESDGRLLGSALINGGGEIILSRPAPRSFAASATLELVLSALLIVVLAAALLYPPVRRVTRAFADLSIRAHHVSVGRFDSPMTAKGSPELASLVEAFNIMSARLEAEETRRRQLVADVSHELRSPIGRLKALADTLARHPEESTELLTRINAEVDLVDRLVTDMQESSRLPNLTARDVKRVSASAWFADATARLRPRLERRGILLNAENTVPDLFIEIDSQRLLQALGNLIDNAEAALVDTQAPRIDLLMQAAADGSWTLSVSDNGHGIPEDQLPYIFDRLFRVQPDRDRATGGAGLGLAIVKTIVEEHGGKIHVTSKTGAGTLFTMTFPRAG